MDSGAMTRWQALALIITVGIIATFVGVVALFISVFGLQLGLLIFGLVSLTLQIILRAVGRLVAP